MTIIVLLILAGVSLNAIIGENGIITNAQRATMLQSCAEIEEYIQEFYVGHSDNLPQNVENKVEALEMYPESKNFFWNPSVNGYGSLGYIVNSDGYKCYFINKDGLPDEIKKNIRGGDAGDGTYFDYAQMNDVYGITSDLKVYYCAEGQNSMLRMTLSDLDKDNPNKNVFSKEAENATETQKAMFSFLEKYDTNEDGVLSSGELKAITSLTITPEDNITSFSEFYYLTNLKTLKLQGLKVDTLDGFSLMPMLSELTFENCVVGNYDGLSSNLNLEFLCFIFRDTNINSNVEVKKLCGKNEDNHLGISGTDYNKLNRLAITGSMSDDGDTRTSDTFKSNISDLSSLSNLSLVTKSSIKKLNIQNNSLTSINFLEGFTGLTYLNIGFCNLFDLKGIEFCKNLEELQGFCQGENFGLNDGDSVDDENNAFYNIQYCEELKIIDFWETNSCKAKYISYINALEHLTTFSFYGGNLNTDDLLKTKSFLKGLKNGYQIASKYNLMFLDSKTTILNLSNTNVEEDIFKTLPSYKNLKHISFHQSKITNDNVEVSDADTNTLLNSIFSQMPQLISLDICYTKLSTVDFIYNKESRQINTPNLVVLQLNHTNVTDLNNLTYLSKLRCLGIDNPEIDLRSIQSVINNCSKDSNFLHGFFGLYIGDSKLLKQLENCTDVTKLEMKYWNWTMNYDVNLNLSKLTKLTNIYLEGLNMNSITLPESITNLTIKNCKSFPDLKNLTKLTYLNFEKGGEYDKYDETNCIDSLSSKILNSGNVEMKIYLTGLNVLTDLNCLSEKFNCNYLEIQNCNSLASLNGINTMKNITEIKCVNDKSLANIKGINELAKLNKLTLYGCGIVDLSEIKDLSNLGYIDLQNNPLAGKNGDVDNISILANLRRTNNSLKLYLSGCNNILDWSKFSEFGTWWHDSEKAGY